MFFFSLLSYLTYRELNVQIRVAMIDFLLQQKHCGHGQQNSDGGKLTTSTLGKFNDFAVDNQLDRRSNAFIVLIRPEDRYSGLTLQKQQKSVN